MGEFVMFGEFCLMRGVDEGSLLSIAEGPGDTCEIKITADQRTLSIACRIGDLIEIQSGKGAHLAGPDGLCGIEREGAHMRFRFIGVDRRARCYEIESVRFDAVLALLSAGRKPDSYASLG